MLLTFQVFGAIESDDWLAVQGRAGAGNEDVSIYILPCIQAATSRCTHPYTSMKFEKLISIKILRNSAFIRLR